ncbi:Perlucin [Lamellibrachia satsuma]|nr:Perlucin [Lamellibrachia satsuma]
MVNRSLILRAVLLCVATVVSAATIKDDPAIGVKPIPRPRPLCVCPKGYEVRREDTTKWSCQCYKFVRDLASWAEAKVYCGVLRARMVEVKDSATHYWLQGQLYHREFSYKHHLLEKAEYWLGATDLEVEKVWKWDPSNTYASFFHWLPNEPNNYLGYQNCLAIRRRCWDAKCIDYGWFDDDCYQKKFYICEKRGKLLAKPQIDVEKKEKT